MVTPVREMTVGGTLALIAVIVLSFIIPFVFPLAVVAAAGLVRLEQRRIASALAAS